MCANRLLDSFNTQHSTSFGKISDEAKSMDQNITDDWVLNIRPDIRWSYKDKDIFNGSLKNSIFKGGIFYKLTPADKTLKYLNGTCVDRKLTQERVIVFVCSNRI